MQKPSIFKVLLSLAFVCALTSASQAATVVGVGANTGTSFRIGGPASQVETISWTQSTGYTSVSISALVGSIDGSPRSVTAYLTSAIFPGAPAPIATTVFSVPSFANEGAITLATIFSGLTLGPGNYYLTLFNGDTTGSANIRWARAPLSFGTLVAANGEFLSNSTNGTPNTTDPWRSVFVASAFYDNGFQVLGTPVPEPSTLTLGTGLLAIFALVARRASK
jgi:hypothetical protein